MLCQNKWDIFFGLENMVAVLIICFYDFLILMFSISVRFYSWSVIFQKLFWS